MTKDVVILIAEDDPGHARLIEKNLRRAGLHNRIIRLEDGQEVLDFFFSKSPAGQVANEGPYLLLLDIRMPKVNGIEVLRRIKADSTLRKIPVTMLTTTDDPREVAQCHTLGCNNYIVKPVDYEKFCEAVQQFGVFVSLAQIPQLGSELAG